MHPMPPNPLFACTVHRSDGQTVVAATGELDVASAGEFDATLREALAGGPVRLDLSELSFMDSSGVRVLDGVLRDGAERGWSLTIRSRLQPGVRQLLTLTGMISVLPMEVEAGT